MKQLLMVLVGYALDLKLVKSGTGQGDPPSAPRYNIGADPGMRAAQKVIDKIGYIFENGLRLPLLGYADDQIAGLNSKKGSEIKELLNVYSEYGEVSGLTINVQKSEIMCINTPIELVNDIKKETGIKVMTGMKHLGIEIRENITDTKKSTYESVSDRVRA